ncbi:methyltransferase domain-containing protein [Bradyrhizobium sp. 2]|uniref:methyltransferase domain-containing protein n=1 Tax=Bradyrhizobium sp. 2 TaxID=190045 RepID=UPI001FFC2A14|nr:methyltransferase domain-containing protein [Bradyrhizobium sp. 2]MCK1460904.1 methyltransferase domain-containing protein [Bradyrhizobium sp. 2]
MDGVLQSGRPQFFDACAERRLTWWPELGVGFYPIEAGVEPYDADYFERYQRQADTEIGRALMQARVDFVNRHFAGAVLDVGIGSGAFIDRRNAASGGRRTTFGFDVNPIAAAWLKSRALWLDPYQGQVPAVTLWDVLEHIPDFGALLDRVSAWVFVSIPIFTSAQHVLRSKHFRRDEHVWYFTSEGLIRTFDGCGFDLAAMNTVETDLGREDIGSFVFRRRA